MKQNGKELQVIEILSGDRVAMQGAERTQGVGYAGKQQKKHRGIQVGRRKRGEGLRTAVRVLFLTVSILFLAYVVLVGVLLYRQKHPTQVDFDKLEESRTTLWTGVLGEGADLEKKMQELVERNEETKDFVENYENRQDYMGKEIDLSGDVREGEVPLLMQWDKRWGYESFGDSNIGLAGCGPTCLSMAYLYFTRDLEGNPREIARYCEVNGYYTTEGTSWELWTVGAKAFGLEGAEIPLDENRMKSALEAGKLIVCSMRPGDFTTTGHYILLIGCDEEGFMVNDPNRRSNSEKHWEYDTLRGQIRNLWEITKAP